MRLVSQHARLIISLWPAVLDSLFVPAGWVFTASIRCFLSVGHHTTTSRQNVSNPESARRVHPTSAWMSHRKSIIGISNDSSPHERTDEPLLQVFDFEHLRSPHERMDETQLFTRNRRFSDSRKIRHRQRTPHARQGVTVGPVRESPLRASTAPSLPEYLHTPKNAQNAPEWL